MTEPHIHSHSDHLETNVYASASGGSQRRISWGAIIAGTIMAIVAQLMFSMLGMGIGLSTINPMSEGGNAADGLGMGAAIWWFITGLISLYLGGWVAGRLAGIPRAGDSMLHGLLTWGSVTIVTLYLLTTSMGALLSGATSVVTKGLSAAGKGIANVAPQAVDAVKDKMKESGIDLSSIRQEAETLLRQTGKPELQPDALKATADQAGQAAQGTAQASAENPQAANMNLDSLMKNLFREGQETVAAADRDAAVNVVVARTGKPKAEAEQIVDRWIATAQDMKAKGKQMMEQTGEKAKEVGEKAASGLSKAALMAFFGGLLGAAAAAFGGRRATPNPLSATLTETRA